MLYLNKQEEAITKLIHERLPHLSEEETLLAKQQLEEFIAIASQIIINNQSRSESLDSLH